MLGVRRQEALARRYAGDDVAVMVKEAFDVNVMLGFQAQFTEDRKVWSAAVFVDIAGFSRKIAGREPKAVRDFLDTFYGVAIPKIYNYQGKIDRIAADGIVAIYSSFFHPGWTSQAVEEAALTCAQGIVRELHGSEYAAKAAVSSGELLFCKTGVAELYEDFTVIGTPLTEVYRLEDVAGESQVLLRADTDLGRRLFQLAKEGYDLRYWENILRSSGIPIANPLPPAKWLVKAENQYLRGVNSDMPVDVLVAQYVG
jgi:class 3 adenylate cyclase